VRSVTVFGHARADAVTLLDGEADDVTDGVAAVLTGDRAGPARRVDVECAGRGAITNASNANRSAPAANDRRRATELRWGPELCIDKHIMIHRRATDGP
jgi:hypothetical protein